MSEVLDNLKIDQLALKELTSSFLGEVVSPENPSYEEHRKVWNGSINRFPAVIARCAGVSDVIAAVEFGQRSGLDVSVRSGGHSFPGHSVNDGGLVIDLSLMRDISVAPDGKTVRAQAGVLLGELDEVTQSIGMAVPAGIVTHTGLAGLTLGGGIGWLMRKHGLTVDQLIRVELITANGEVVPASGDENPDLFWGVRGAGSNFGIISEFEFRLNPVGPEVLAGPIVWPMEKSPEVLRFYRDWITEVPDELTTIVIHRKIPPVPLYPHELHGQQAVMVGCCFAGPIDEGEKVLAPLKAFSSPWIDLCVPKPFLQHQAMFDPSFPHGFWYYMRACDVAELTDEVIDITVEYAMKIESPLTAFPIFQLGGAIARVGEDETPFGGRQAGHTFNLAVTTESKEGFDEQRDWARTFWEALSPFHTSVYVNFLLNEGEDRIKQAYGSQKYDRLTALKRQYDPQNFFHHNQNIPPN